MAGASRQTAAFRLLGAGAALFAIALAILAWRGEPVVTTAYMLTPLFGLPFLAAAARRPGAWRACLYFLILLPAFHYLATVAAIKATGSELDLGLFVAGLAGGAVGSALSLLPFLQISRHPRRRLLVLAGIALLALLGGAGLWAGEGLSRQLGGQYALIALLFLPWQILFAWLLSRLLAPARPPAAACGAAPGPA